MLLYDTSLIKKLHQGYGAMQKEIKRCIPKEDMPHASACQKNKRSKIAPIQKERKRYTKGVHTPSTKNIHTLAHLDQGL